MDLETKAIIMAAINRYAATQVRLRAAEALEEVAEAPSPVSATLERYKELATTQEAYIEKLLDAL